MEWKAGGAFIKFFFIIAVLIHPLTPPVFSRQSYKSGSGDVKATSMSHIELGKANCERRKKLVIFFF